MQLKDNLGKAARLIMRSLRATAELDNAEDVRIAGLALRVDALEERSGSEAIEAPRLAERGPLSRERA